MNLKAMRVALARSRLTLAIRAAEKAHAKLRSAQWDAEYAMRDVRKWEDELAALGEPLDSGVA